MIRLVLLFVGVIVYVPAMAECLEDIEELEERVAKVDHRVLKDRADPYHEFSDVEFYARYRFDQAGARWLAEQFCQGMERRTNRMHPPPPQIMILITLKYLASSNFLQDVGDYFKYSKSCVMDVVDHVTESIVAQKDEYIHLPSGPEEDRVKRAFQEKCLIPGVIGCIDCTHIKVPAPAEEAFAYINRKGFKSINVQAMCNDRYMFTNVVAKWPGSRHDSSILKKSSLWQTFESGEKEGIILGDGGYPLRKWLMVPFRDPQEGPRRRFNAYLSSARVSIENTFGQLKSRFVPLRDKLLTRRMGKCCSNIVACCILHNIAKMRNLEDFDFEINPVEPALELEDNEEDEELAVGLAAGTFTRDKFMQQYFA